MSNQQSVIEFAKSIGTKKLTIVDGPNGRFLFFADANNKKIQTMPVGKKSYTATLAELTILVTDDNAMIATANKYETAEELTF